MTRPTTPARTSARTGPRRSLSAAAVLAPAVLVSACGAAGATGAGAAGTDPSAAGDPSAGRTSSAPTEPTGDGPWPGPEPEATEAGASAPRLVLTHDGGLLVLDATTLEPVGGAELDGFARVNPVGDGRHVMVSTTGGFAVLDAGTWARPHGDHDHYWTADPRLSEVLYPAEEPGHVVAHAGRTVLFDDGTGDVVTVASGAVADPDADRVETSAGEAHHGVALELSDGTTVLTEGTEDARSTVRVLDPAGAEVARTDDCPGVHGEATAADEAVVIGCEDGLVIWARGVLTEVDAPDPYGRIGNQAGSEVSPFVLGDYKSDPDAELERPTRVSVVDTTTGGLRLVDLPSSYSFRSLGRGDAGEALVLGTDGALHVVDPASAALVRSVPVVAAWEEPEDWQQPRPALFVHDGTAYVTEPATQQVHAVDVETGQVWASAELDVVPNEITGVSGDVEAGAELPEDQGGHDDVPSPEGVRSQDATEDDA